MNEPSRRTKAMASTVWVWMNNTGPKNQNLSIVGTDKWFDMHI